MDLKLQDKVVLVTGATGGLGTGICKAFLREGAKVCAQGRNPDKIKKLVEELDAGDRLFTHLGDVTEESAAKSFVEESVKHFGTIDILIPNAGYEGKWEMLPEVTKENFDKVMYTNVLSTIYLFKYGLPILGKKGKGSAVAISSNGALVGAPGMSVYVASKHAMSAVMKTAAIEYGPLGVHVNSVNPGGIDTEMVHRIEDNAFGDGMDRAKKTEQFAGGCFDKRYVTVEEVADMVCVLASDVCSHMFGGKVHMDGGDDTKRP